VRAGGPSNNRHTANCSIHPPRMVIVSSFPVNGTWSSGSRGFFVTKTLTSVYWYSVTQTNGIGG
jgi:hypothetical protein